MLIGINLKLPRPMRVGPGYIYHYPRVELESGFDLLLEDLSYLLLENADSLTTNMELEDGDNVLLEDLDFLLLET